MSTAVEIEAAIEQLPSAEQAKLRALLLGQAGPVTNVEPLPDVVARRLYNEADDDTDAIRLFMAAQAKSIEEWVTGRTTRPAAA
jgi:hypothetical protein